jgi:hypothetical protein
MSNALTFWRMRNPQKGAGIALCQARICSGARSTGTCADRLRRTTGSLRHKCSIAPSASRNQRVPLHGWVKEEREKFARNEAEVPWPVGKRAGKGVDQYEMRGL